MRHRIVLLCFVLAWMGLSGGADARAGELDCNNNGVPDAMELSGNDCNANGVLDVCENDRVVAVAEISGIKQSPAFQYQQGNIDIDGGIAVVGRPSNYVVGVGFQPRVDCYEYMPQTGWQHTQTIVEAASGNLGAFGDCVDVCGDRLAITAPREGYPASQQGAVYCYRRIGGVWQFQQKLEGTHLGGLLGRHVVLEANRLFVSETSASSNDLTAPRVHCYVDHGAGFELEQTIHMTSWIGPIGHLTGDIWFGVHNDVMIVYEPQPTELVAFPPPPTGQTSVLTAVIYEWSNGRWAPVKRMVFEDLQPSSFENCYIEKNRIIITPIVIQDIPIATHVVVIEKDETGWHRAQSIYLPVEVPKWVEKSAGGYFVGTNELVASESGLQLIDRPELGSVFDRGNRSGNWWGVEVDPTAFPYPISNISQVIADCDSDGVLDECEIAQGAPDVDLNLVPDTCQTDCNADGIPDESQLELGDCNANGVLDVCDLDPLDPDGDGVTWSDCNQNGMPDACETDCDGNGVPDTCDLDPADPDGNGLVADDCDANGRPDSCDIEGGVVRLAEIRPGIDASAFSFGRSLSLDGDVLAVGCPGTTGAVPITDRVFVYRRTGNHWVEEASIVPGNLPEDLLTFGYWVAVSGNVLVIKGEGQFASGTAYLYTYVFDGADWEYASTTTISQNASLVSDMVLDGNRLAVSTDNSRSITIYEYENGVWTAPQVVSLLATDGYAEQIALHDDLLIAGYGANESQIFRFNGTGWEIVARSRHIGITLSTVPLLARPVTDGDRVVFGNRRGGYPRSGSPFFCGSTLVYRLIGDDLIVEDFLYGVQDGEPLTVTEFGSSTALVGDRLIVGSPAFDASRGRVQLFEREGGNWVLRQTIDSPVAPNSQAFGSLVAASGDTLAVVASGLGLSTSDTNNDVIYIYETDLDIDNDGILDTCETDCDGNHYPDHSEQTIDGFVHALLNGGAACVFDQNDDGGLDGLDVPVFVDQLLTGH